MFLSPGSLGGKSTKALINLIKNNLPAIAPVPTRLNIITPSGVASVADTTSIPKAITQGFTKVQLIGYGITFNTNAVNFSMLLSTNGGVTYFNSSGNYSLAGLVWEATTVAANAFTARAGINVSTLTNTAGANLTFDAVLYNIQNNLNTMIRGQAAYINNVPAGEGCLFFGELGAPNANAIQWNVSAGTFSGTIEMWGLP
jgi:hypothetical protein